MRWLLFAIVAVLACRREPAAEPPATGSGSAQPTSTKPVTRTSTEGAAALAYTVDGSDVRATHALADIGPNDMSIFISTMPLTCADLHEDAVVQTPGVVAMLPVGPARDYYNGKAVGVPVWSHGPNQTHTLAAPFATLAIDRFDAKAARISGELRFAGRAHAIGASSTQQLAGAGRFEAGICDFTGRLADPAPRPLVHLDQPFAGLANHQPFVLARAYAIVCGAPGNRFVARLEFSAAATATCKTFWDAPHVELDDIGGSAESAPVLGEVQPAGSMVGDGMGGDSRSGTASVTWKHLAFEVGATITGSAQVDRLDERAKDGGPWTEASGTFSAEVCADELNICRASGG